MRCGGVGVRLLFGTVLLVSGWPISEYINVFSPAAEYACHDKLDLLLLCKFRI